MLRRQPVREPQFDRLVLPADGKLPANVSAKATISERMLD
jgi:hypothetical protein